MGTGLGDVSLYPLVCLFEFCTICITYSKTNKIFLNTAAGHRLLKCPLFIYLPDLILQLKSDDNYFKTS